MKQVIIFGATDTGKNIYEDISGKENVIAFIDEDEKMWGSAIKGIRVCSPDAISTLKYDYIYVGVLTYYREVISLLANLNVPEGKIVDRYVAIPTYARIECLKNIQKVLAEDEVLQGHVAELGVYQGEFAKEINRIFPDRKLYLFDTFEGFDEKDCQEEIDRGYFDANRKGYFGNTTENLVLGKMPHPENCIICKGFFPESVKDVEETFCFVNLDADLYAPTLAGLEYFYPRLVNGGIILIHDYFSKAFTGVKDAVKTFCKENNIKYLPIGDTLSVAIRK